MENQLEKDIKIYRFKGFHFLVCLIEDLKLFKNDTFKSEWVAIFSEIHNILRHKGI